MICKKGGFVTQRHNELRDLEAELLNMVCTDVEIEPVLQDISGDIARKAKYSGPNSLEYGSAHAAYAAMF